MLFIMCNECYTCIKMLLHAEESFNCDGSLLLGSIYIYTHYSQFAPKINLGNQQNQKKLDLYSVYIYMLFYELAL